MRDRREGHNPLERAMIGEGLLEDALVYIVRNRNRVRLVAYALFSGSRRLRVAFAALLRVHDPTSGRYLLVRNLHQSDTFGPFGGIYKFLPSARPLLDSCEFSPHVAAPFGNDMRSDLRGFLPVRNAIRLISWYHRGVHRELGPDCIKRELREELGEVGLQRRIRVPDGLRFNHVRTVFEGPDAIPGQDYLQVRVFDVFDLIPHSRAEERLVQRLVEHAGDHEDLVMAHADEIRTGRCADGRLLGHHSGYLIWQRRIRPDTPIFPAA